MEVLQINKTGDGSLTLYSSVHESAYHSKHGALTESTHVFIENGLKNFPKIASKVIGVFEMGFGTGLNAWLTQKYAREQQIKIKYTGIDIQPIDQPLIQNIAIDAVHMELLSTPWETEKTIHEYFTIQKLNIDLIEYLHQTSDTFDIVYYDAFGPGSQPELWEDPIFHQLYQLINPGGIFTTYCAKGSVRRALKDAGCIAQKIDGPPGKRHMIVANKPLASTHD